MIYKIVLVLLFFSTSAISNESLLIGAASSLKDAYTEIGKIFTEETQITVSFSFSSSGKIKDQIINGAPIDLFASASKLDIDQLTSIKLINPTNIINFAQNSIVLITNKKNKCQLLTLSDLTHSQAHHIAIGNVKTVPAGRYAKESLEKNMIYQNIKNKLVFAETVRQVLDYVSRDEVEYGIVFQTDAQINKNVITCFNIPPSQHSKIIYPIGIVSNTKKIDSANKFLKFISSNKAKDILRKHGFIP